MSSTLSHRHDAVGRQKPLTIALWGLLVWTLVWVWTLRQHYLDDAFIHLRYAENLLSSGQFSYNGEAADFGTSSPGYTSLLALFVAIFGPHSWIPKFVGLAVFAALWLLLAWQVLRSEGSRRLALFVYLCVLCTPMALRWLTDGMETGLVTLAGIGLGLLARSPAVPPVILFAGSVLATLIRVEFMFVLAAACAAEIATGWFARSTPGLVQRSRPLRGLAMLAGGLLGVLFIWLHFGAVIPDTAIAKRPPPGTPIELLGTLVDVASAHVTASIFGIGLLTAWLVSLFAAWQRPECRISVGVINLAWCGFVVLLIVTQQQLQGIRYFCFLYSFLIGWNAAMANGSAGRITLKRKVLIPVAAALAVLLTADSWVVGRLSGGRSETYRRFATSDLSGLHGVSGVSADVGFIGYFSGGMVRDIHGLVNGREFAARTERNRIADISRGDLAFSFLNQHQLSQVAPLVSMKDWECVLTADFPNASLNADRHWLLVRPDVFARMSAAQQSRERRCASLPQL